MTYFEHYVCIHREKTLRGHTRPFDSTRYTHLKWGSEDAGANKLYHNHFHERKAIPLITPRIANRLNPVPDRVYAAETLHTNLEQSFGNRHA